MKKPILREAGPLIAVVCEDGKVYCEGSGIAVDDSPLYIARNYRAGEKTQCKCTVHRIMRYNPGTYEEIKVNPKTEEPVKKKKPKMPTADEMKARGLIGPDMPKSKRKDDDLTKASREHHGPSPDMGPGGSEPEEE